MAKVLIVENDLITANNFIQMFDLYDEFDVDVVSHISEAKKLLSNKRYEFGVTDLELNDSLNGEMVAIFNKHNISPIVFTNKINEDFIETYQSANIVDYVVKSRYRSTNNVVDTLRQLILNKRSKILLISNTQTYSNYLKQNLQMHNFQILIAKNSQESLEKLDLHEDIDLVITEYDLPIVNGLELVKKIRKTRRKSDLNILVLAEKSNSYLTACFLNEGVNDYLIKEFSRDELYTRVYQNVPLI